MGADASGRLEADVDAAVPPATLLAQDPVEAAADALERRAAGWATIGVVVIVSIAVSLWFLPVWYGIPMAEPEIRLRYWPPRWP